MKTALFILSFGLILTSCSLQKNLIKVSYDPNPVKKTIEKSVIETKLLSKKDTSVLFTDYVSLGQKRKLWNSGELLIVNTERQNINFDDFKMDIGFSKEKYPSDNSYTPLINDKTRYKAVYSPESSTYTLSGKTFNDLIKQENGDKRLVNGNWINIKITDKKDSLLYNANFQFKKDFSWFTKLSTPLLYIADGDLGEFELRKFTPSLGVTILQKNINTTSKWNYVSLNGLIDVQSWEKDVSGTMQTKYSMGAGLTLEIAGYFQFGWTYNFNKETCSFVIGATPELIQKMFGIKE